MPNPSSSKKLRGAPESSEVRDDLDLQNKNIKCRNEHQKLIPEYRWFCFGFILNRFLMDKRGWVKRIKETF